MPGPFAGSGGGLFGAVAALIAADANLGAGYFSGGRVFTGKAPRTAAGSLTSLPFVRLAHVAGTAQRQSDGVLLIPTTFQASVFSENYDECRCLGRDLDALLAGARLAVDGVLVTLFLDIPGEALLMMDPERSENGSDVWHSPSRFRVELTRQPGPGERGEN